ncbi:hypothetical protein SARC_04273 [Sphaeroforma arctica JP610]|uniref:Arf-GAP domain-containing protein n=1 Tax=Sphaeroforma arctica JP610 TaxID=667725 RepID=A0A0L0G3M4_9EUKA|nr:hypothetical protein SARC_04273 [Sphaeroforma arctica JP610]KNC83464.1 hypothetical protein SARC_04273 [Sphaeroforma arctica JP610]|eukprot:XP_014157366.1 hypothetical protein SARC_04273 [Sphaeroforma arctica JP610]
MQALSLQAKDAWIATLQAHISNALDVGVSRPQNEANLSAGKSFSSMNVLPMSNTRREEIKAVLGNDTCCDCGVPDNTWASINLGILLCIECSGVHRKIGTHISKVRSMTLDRWDDSLMQVSICINGVNGNRMMMLAIGNTNLNSVYLSGVDDTDELMREMCSDRTKREAFIRSKYIDKAFMATSEMDKDDLNQILFDASKEASDMILAVRAVANGADVNWQTDFNDDWAPLHACCHFQNVACAEFLYQNYANINTADKQGRTPLHVAADEGHEIMVEFLLSRGATVEVKDEEGKSPLDLALAKFHPTVVTHLRLHQLEKMEVMDRTRARERRDDKTREEILKTQDEDEAAQSPLMMDSP